MPRVKIIGQLAKDVILNPKRWLKKITIAHGELLFHYLFRASVGERETLSETLSLKNRQSSDGKKYQQPAANKRGNLIPVFDEVQVSIVIPVYNQWSLTHDCISSIINSVENVKYEVILADDASTDETSAALTCFKNLRVVRNDPNLGFLLNCNNAAKHAKGEYLVFLNNDTVVHDYWLEALTDKMNKDPRIAICGSKLVFPDGTLQEAGGIIWDDASGWNYGRGDDPSKAEYSYCKEVDYISGASIMVRREFWEEVGGFDKRYVPAYYEDTDLAFEAVNRGYKVVFHPHSVVTHFEGKSHGTDEASGTKAYQVTNRLKFAEKWQKKLASEHFKNAEHVFQARDRSANKRTILVIDHYVPWFDKDAGSRSTYMYLQMFVELGYNVKFLGDNFFPHQPYTDYLNEMGIEVLHGKGYAENWENWIKLNAECLDVVYLHRPHIAPKYIDFIRKHTSAKIVYQCHDLHHVRIQRDFENTGEGHLKREALRMKKIEEHIFNTVDISLTFSHDEKAILNSYKLSSRVEQIPLFLYDNIKEKPVDFDKREGMLFVGGFNHKPNEEGVNWFLEEVFPSILKKLPTTIFYIVGSNVPKNISTKASDNVSVLGFVSDDELAQLYQKVKVCVLPLLHGAGVKGKLVEAMQCKTPVVSTTVGIEGVNVKAHGISGFDNPSDFSSELIKTLTDEVYWLRLQSSYSEAFIDEFSKKNFSKSCVEIF